MKIRTNAEIGKSMERLRLKNGLTQEKLAERAGVPLKHIKDIEDGAKRASSVSLLKIFCALGVEKPDDILYE